MRRTCLESIHALAVADERVLFLGSDLGAGTLDEMREAMPARFFMEGICEQNLVGMAAGLAFEGFVPYVNTIATFLTRRCFEQIAVDVCLHELPVRLVGNGGGAVYAPLGPTHTAVDDIALMRALPGMTVIVPTDAEQMRRLVPLTLDWPGPIYLRLAKGGDPVVPRGSDDLAIGRAMRLREGADALIVACGITVVRALDAAQILAAQGVECTVLDVHTPKPLDADTILGAAHRKHAIVTVEEHARSGGLGSAVLECLADARAPEAARVRTLGFPDRYPQGYGSQDDHLTAHRLTAAGIADAVRDVLAYGGIEDFPRGRAAADRRR